MFTSARIITSFTVVLAVVNFAPIYGFRRVECGPQTFRFSGDIEKLRNCTAVLGNLEIVFTSEMISGVKPNSTDNWKFPLREVTGYIFIYALYGVDSLGAMFPNLTLIRGQRLFSNYAFIIYETELKELSLRNLLKISRGSVRIDGYNENLCLPKIDWDRIITNGQLILGKIPLSTNCEWMGFKHCHSCEEDHMCWKSDSCQRFETSFKLGKKRKKCHDLCLGDCENQTASGCYVCKDISENGTCVESCSKNLYLNTDTKRCITATECTNLTRTIYQSTCMIDCPSGFQAIESQNEKNETTRECIRCLKRCPKYCSGKEISRISHLESLGIGCTVITTDLQINLHDDVNNITEELQSYLGNVEEIRGVLKIHRSSPITSLAFLNKLRIVGSKTNRTTAVQIFENQNLQTTFDWRTRGNLSLNLPYDGTIQIYQNSLLCTKEIKKFKSIVSRGGNPPDILQGGGKCRSVKIETSFEVTSHNSTTIRWKNINPADSIMYNAYIIQHVRVKSPEHVDEKMWFERDSCSSYGWKQTFIGIEDWKFSSNGLMEYNLTNLNQWTTYAFSVQTYQFGPNETIGSVEELISDVKTFRTFMDIPMRVRNLEVFEKSSSSITIQWNLLENEASAIAYIHIFAVEVPFNITLIDRRNYCHSPIKEEFVRHYRAAKAASKDCCEQCCEEKLDEQKEEDDFEMDLIKFGEKVPKKRLSPEMAVDEMVGKQHSRSIVLGNETSFTAEDLKALTMYRFHVFACTADSKCSNYEMLTEITDSNLSGDFDKIVLKPTSTVFESEHFHFRFNEPEQVNGVITSYITEISAVNGNNYVYLFAECSTRLQHQESGFKFSVQHLSSPGYYTFRVVAISLGGKGPYTDYHEFEIVPIAHEVSKGWILLGFIIILLFVTVVTVSIYYRHKIVTLVRRQNDTVHLLNDIEPVNFEEISLHHKEEDPDPTPKRNSANAVLLAHDDGDNS